MKRKFFGLTALCLAALLSSAEAGVYQDGPQIGDPAPPLYLKLLNAPPGADASWEKLKGKVVVLDFWATWCPPCILSIPHLNALVDELKNEPIQFIAVTAEPEPVVSGFLKKNPFEKHQSKLSAKDKVWADPVIKTFQEANPIHAWIGLDDLAGQDPENYYGGKTVSGFYFYGVPHCVIVDKDGKIAAYVHPLELNAAYLKKILAGERPEIPEPDRPEEELKMWRQMKARDKDRPRSSSEPFFEVSIRRSKEWLNTNQENKTLSRDDRVSFARSRVTLDKFVSELNALPPDWIEHQSQYVAATNLSTAKYDFKFVASKETFFSAVETALMNSFPIEFRRATQPGEQFRLRIAADGKPSMRVSAKRGSSIERTGPASLSFSNVNMRSLVNTLRKELGKNVIDETRLSGDYDFELRWDAPGDVAETITKALREQLGLELVGEAKPVEVIYLESKNKN